MSSTELSPPARQRLLKIALDSIQSGLETGKALAVAMNNLPEELTARRASFVTLNTANGDLRGCIGSLEAHRGLVEDISYNAYAAAFRDPRFPPLQEDELDRLTLHISVLSCPEELVFDSEEALLGLLRPGIDGLILQEKEAKGTFLPSVWESLPDAGSFLAQLKGKAGLPADYWSGSVRVWRYTTESFAASVSHIRRAQDGGALLQQS